MSIKFVTMISTYSLRVLVSLIFLLGSINEASAQPETTAQVKCPVVSVSCVSENRCFESPFYLVANVTETDPRQKFSYHWTAAHRARIISGHGTSMIKVEGENGYVVTLELKGLPAECKNATASIASIWDAPPPVQEIDEFGPIPFAEVKPHLDKLAYQLRNSPGATGSIVSTGKWRFAKNAVNYLWSKHGIPSERIFLVDQKRKGPILIKLFIVPPGAVPPG